MDDFTATGDQTHVYAGSETSTTDYTVTVHLATADGVYVNAGTIGVTVDDVAPVVTLDDPAGGGTTGTAPTLTGTAGITPGDADTVTLNIYSGSSVAGSPVVSADVDVDPDTGEFSYTVDSGSPLAAGTYTFQTVQDEDAGNDATSDPQTFTVALQDPQAVTNLAATAASATEIDLTWDAAPASDYVNNFSVYESTDYGATFTLYDTTDDGSATGMNVTCLTPNTAYVFDVIANNDTGSSPDNVTLPTWTDDGIAAPTGLATHLIDDGMGGIKVTWVNHSTDATGIEVEAKWAGSGQFETIASLDACATSFCTSDWYSDGVPVGWITEDVTFRVRSVGTGESAYSDPLPYTADTSFMGSGDVYGLSATAGARGYCLSWTQPDDSPYYSGGYDFTIYARKQGDVPGEFGAWESIGSYELKDSSTATVDYQDLSWSDGMQVAIGSSAGGCLALSNMVTLSMVQNLSTPTLDVHFDCDTGLYDFTWTSAGDGDISYEIINMGASGGGEESIAHVLAYTYDATSLETSFQANGGYFAVLAYDSCGDVSMSDVIDVDIAYTPATLTAKAIVDGDGNGEISLEWANTSYNETGFEIQRSTDDATWTTLATVDPDVTSYVDSGVDAGTPYYYQVIAAKSPYGDPIPTKSMPVTTGPATAHSFKLEILWNGLEIDNGTTITNGENITGMTIDYFAGQKISLALNLLVDGTARPIGYCNWTLGGTAGDFIAGYTPTTTSYASGTVAPIAAADLRKTSISFYSAVDAPNHVFNVTAGVLSASVTFNIKKAGHSIWGGSLGVTAGQTPTTVAAGAVFTSIDFQAPEPTGFVGTLNWVQTTKSAITYGRSIFLGGGGTVNTTFGNWYLDNVYPYDSTSGGTHVVGGITYRYDGDHPDVRFGALDNEYVINQSFEMWLMWTPPGGDSIPVPIELVSWSWSATVDYNSSTKTWVLTAGTPVAALTSYTGSLTDAYPYRIAVYYNKK